MSIIYSILGSLLKIIYDMVGHYGWSIIIFTLIVKIALLPLSHAQNRSMKEMQALQPKMDEIKKKYPNNQEKQSQLTMELYREHNVNPFMGCLPLLVQFPLLIGLFGVLRNPVQYVFGTEAAFQQADQGFFWIKSMSQPDVIMVGAVAIPFILPIISAVATYVDSMLMQRGQPKNQMTTTMTYMMPILLLIWGRTFPSGVILYWTVSNLFSIVQKQLLMPAMNSDKKDNGSSKGAKK